MSGTFYHIAKLCATKELEVKATPETMRVQIEEFINKPCKSIVVVFLLQTERLFVKLKTVRFRKCFTWKIEHV